MTTTPGRRDLTRRDGVSLDVDPGRHQTVDPGLEGGARRSPDWRGEFFRALFDSLSRDEQRWVLDRIAAYASLNAELGDPARI